MQTKRWKGGWNIEMWQLISQSAPRSSALIPGAHLFDSCHMCAVIGSKCMAAHRSCMWLMGRRENVLPFPVDLGEIVLIGHKDFTLTSWLTVKLWQTSLRLFFQVAVSSDNLHCLRLLWRFVWPVQPFQPDCSLLCLLAQGLLSKLW